MARPKIHAPGVSRQSVMRAKRRQAGLCVECGLVETPGRCEGCRRRIAESRQACVRRRAETWDSSLVGRV